MTLVESRSGAGSISRAPRPSSLADVLDLILDKGLVIDAYVRVSVAGIEVLTIDARVVVASVDTYLRFAEAVNRLDLGKTEEPGIRALKGESSQSDSDDGDGDGDEDDGGEGGGRRRSSQNGALQRGRSAKSESERSEKSSRDRRSGGGGDDEENGPGLLGRIAERAKFDK